MWRRLLAYVGSVAFFAFGVSVIMAQDVPATPAPQGQSLTIVVSLDLFERGAQKTDAGDYEGAIQDYSLFILMNPTWSVGYYQRGQTYAALGEFEAALSDYTQALNLPSPSPDLTGEMYTARALIYMQQNDTENALDDLNNALVAFPDYADAYLRRGQIHLFNEDWEDALSDYDKLIELAPNFVGGYAGRAVIHTQLGDAEAALADYDQLLELEPEDALSYYRRGSLRHDLEDYTGALVDLDEAIRLQPNQSGFYLLRASIHQSLGNTVQAAADYFEWMRLQEQDSLGVDRLRPRESLVVPLSQGVVYFLPFDARAGQRVTLSADARPDAATDPLIVLLDTANTPVIADDDSGGGFNALIEGYTIPADGTYTLLVSHAGGDPNGAVRVLLSLD
jgi:tetratricopeptide (TPR) repeat protein